ncbi:MAG: LLM class flavin-dependent oxidoreductase, partial [Candidatus Binataceae bacterium]
YNLAGSGPTHSQQLYDGAIRSAGREPNDYSIAQLMISTYVAKTHEDAWNEAEESVHYVLNSYQSQFKRIQETLGDSLLNKKSLMPPLPAADHLRKTPGLTFFGAPILVGSPEEVREMIERYRSATRVTHMVCWMQLPGLSAARARNSMELFARDVMPHFTN